MSWDGTLFNGCRGRINAMCEDDACDSEVCVESLCRPIDAPCKVFHTATVVRKGRVSSDGLRQGSFHSSCDHIKALCDSWCVSVIAASDTTCQVLTSSCTWSTSHSVIIEIEIIATRTPSRHRRSHIHLMGAPLWLEGVRVAIQLHPSVAEPVDGASDPWSKSGCTCGIFRSSLTTMHLEARWWPSSVTTCQELTSSRTWSTPTSARTDTHTDTHTHIHTHTSSKRQSWAIRFRDGLRCTFADT